MFNRLNHLLLLLLCLVYHSGNTYKPVSGEKGGNIRLTCEHEDKNIVLIDLYKQSEKISVCETEECRGRVFKEGNCDVVIKNLIFSDAGKYTLRIYYNNNQTELKPKKEWTFDLHIHDKISVKTGEELKMHVLLSNAYKVETNSSGEWKEVWNRTHGVLDHHLTDTDGNLTIKFFLDSDAGTYRVLDTEGEIFITVTVIASSTESGTESLGKHNNTDIDQPKDTGQHMNWIVPVVVCLVILAVIVIVIVIYVIKLRRQRREHAQVPADEQRQELEEL